LSADFFYVRLSAVKSSPSVGLDARDRASAEAAQSVPAGLLLRCLAAEPGTSLRDRVGRAFADDWCAVTDKAVSDQGPTGIAVAIRYGNTKQTCRTS